jgi:site-specific DNA-methyltransferase (adenine-specific)
MIEDYPDSSSVFPGTHVKSGVCFFLWDRDNPGDARITTHRSETSKSVATRPLREPGADVFLRYNESISIIKKVMAFENETTFAKVSLQLPEAKRFSNLVSARKPFGIPSNFRGKEARQKKTDLVIYQNYGHGYVPVNEIRMGKELIDSWKVFLGKAYGGDEKYPHAILSQPFIGEPQSVCTETYLVIGPFSSKRKCEVVVDYISTRLFRFLVLLRKPTQNSSRSTYSYVPILDFSQSWSDDDLASRYSLTRTEQEFIKSMVRPMGTDDE